MGSCDHAVTCAFCGYDRGGMNDSKCLCDDFVESGAALREFADKARAIAEARDEACETLRLVASRDIAPGDLDIDGVERLAAVGKEPRAAANDGKGEK